MASPAAGRREDLEAYLEKHGARSLLHSAISMASPTQPVRTQLLALRLGGARARARLLGGRGEHRRDRRARAAKPRARQA